MIRNAIVAVVVGSVISTLAVVVPSDQSRLLAQSTDEVVVDAPPPIQLQRGQRYETALWDLQVGNTFMDESPDRPGWSELRIEVSMRNNRDEPLSFGSTSFFDGVEYPRLVVVDSDGFEREYSVVRPHRTAVSTSTLRELPGGLTGMWTVGFQIPTKATSEMALVARTDDGINLAAWDLIAGAGRESWDPATGVTQVAIGDTFDWAPDLEVTAVDHGSLVCGNPDLEYVTHIYALRVDVANLGVEDDLEFPGATFPATAAYVQWSDGASGELAGETFYGSEETLIKYTFDNVLIPPTRGDAFSRSLIFAVPRDARLTDADAAPAGVYLRRPQGPPVYVDVAAAPGDVFLNPAFCADGHFDFVLPGSFAPSHDFQVGLATPEPTDEELDAAARRLLVQALIVVARFYSENGSFEDVTAADLESRWAGLDFVEDFDEADLGVISFEVPADDEILLFTQSGSDLFICAGDLVGSPTVFSESAVIADLETACITTVEEDETATTTTTTTP